MADMTTLYGAGGFDTSSAPPAQDFELLPPGWYGAFVEETELLQTKAGDGWRLAVTFQVVDPAEYAGRKLFENMNLQNPNPKAVEIGQRMLCGLGQAVGLPACPDSDLLLNKMMEMKVAIKTPKPTAKYPDPKPENVIREFRAVGVAPAPAVNPQTVVAPVAVPAAPVAPVAPVAVPVAVQAPAVPVAPAPVPVAAVPAVPAAPVAPVAPVANGTPPWMTQ